MGRVCLRNWMTVNYIGALLFKQMDEMIESPNDENFRTRLHILEILYEFYQNGKNFRIDYLKFIIYLNYNFYNSSLSSMVRRL